MLIKKKGPIVLIKWTRFPLRVYIYAIKHIGLSNTHYSLYLEIKEKKTKGVFDNTKKKTLKLNFVKPFSRLSAFNKLRMNLLKTQTR